MEPADVATLTSPAGRRLLDQLSGQRVRPEDLPALTTRLRRDHPAELVAAALTQVRLRDRARARFGPDADVMLFTPTGLEQATRASVARHRAERVARLTGGVTADLGCGIGGDLIALGRAELTVRGFDTDAVTAAVAAANLAALGLDDRVEVQRADVTELDLERYDAVTCDPSRRTASGGRTVDPRAYEPPWGFVTRLLARTSACVKVAPGIPHAMVPAGVEAEWVSDRGEVTEAALWSGNLCTTAGHRATLLPSGVTLTRTVTDPPPVSAPGRFLYEPDGAVIRAGLVAEVAAAVDGALLDPRIAYVCADQHVPTPFATCYEVRDALRFSLKRLRAYLRERGIGRVTLKKRGTAVDLDRLRHDLRLAGDGEAVVVLTRTAEGPLALACDRA
ncbi:MAG: THUMP-like domain-containing protein [Streptosporangiales bacterium]